MTDQNAIYQQLVDDVLAERQKQRDRFTTEHDGRHDALQWAGLQAQYIGRAVDAGEDSDSTRYRDSLVKAAAVALAALESFDVVMAEISPTDAAYVERYGNDPE